MKTFVPVLVDKLNDPAEPVREGATDALASILKVGFCSKDLNGTGCR